MAQMPLEGIFYARFDNTQGISLNFLDFVLGQYLGETWKGTKIDFEYPKTKEEYRLKEIVPKLLVCQIYGKVMTIKTHVITVDGKRNWGRFKIDLKIDLKWPPKKE